MCPPDTDIPGAVGDPGLVKRRKGGRMRMKKKKKREVRSRLISFLFTLPSLFFFSLALLIPFVMGLNIAFTDWNGIAKEYNNVGF